MGNNRSAFFRHRPTLLGSLSSFFVLFLPPIPLSLCLSLPLSLCLSLSLFLTLTLSLFRPPPPPPTHFDGQSCRYDVLQFALNEGVEISAPCPRSVPGHDPRLEQVARSSVEFKLCCVHLHWDV